MMGRKSRKKGTTSLRLLINSTHIEGGMSKRALTFLVGECFFLRGGGSTQNNNNGGGRNGEAYFGQKSLARVEVCRTA